jgi:hypothetical protein
MLYPPDSSYATEFGKETRVVIDGPSASRQLRAREEVAVVGVLSVAFLGTAVWAVGRQE